MSDPAKPLILVLDPDQDFTSALATQAGTRDVNVVIEHYDSKTKLSLEELILSKYPDIVVVNMDQDSHLDHGTPILEIKKIPVSLPPIIMATTARDALALKQKSYDYGADDYLIRPFTPNDVWLRLDVLLRIRKLQKQLDHATRKLSSLNAQLADSNRSLEVMTITDDLTGLHNMRFMLQYLDKQFQLFSRYDRPFAIMMIDLDHFKEVNDQNDHLVGSNTIKAVGAIINQSTRGSDIKARYGGDEYIVAMPETTSDSAILVGERIRGAVEAQKFKGNETSEFNITSSIGISIYDIKRHKSFSDIIKDADYALYLAKKNGRNQVVIYDHRKTSAAGKDQAYDETQSAVMTELKKRSK